MAYLNEILRRFENLQAEELAKDALIKTEEDLADVQRQQMLDGVGPSGKGSLGNYRYEWYANLKNAQNPRAGFDNKDLYRTGDFSRKITAHIVGDEVIFDSTGIHTEQLVAQAAKDGTEVFGLNPEYRNLYVKTYLRPAWIKMLEEQLKMKIAK